MVITPNNSISNKTLASDGFVKLNLFTATELNELTNKIHNINIDNKTDSLAYHVTLLSSKKEYKKEVKDLLNPYLDNLIKSFMKGYKVILTNLIIKNAGCGEVPLHQNWTFVDESVTRSYTLWIPLVDTNETNGTLEFIAGTHQLFADEKRGHNTPYFFLDEVEKLKKYLIPVNIKTGEALLFDDSILHYSKPNLSTDARIAIQATIVPESASLYHYHFQKSFFYNKLYKLPVNIDFFENFSVITDKNSVCSRFIKRKITAKEWQQIDFFHKLQRKNLLNKV